MTVAAIIGLVGCAGFISTVVLLHDMPIRAAVASPITVVSNVMVTVGFAVLAATLPLLSVVLRLPVWIGMVTSVAAACIAAVAWGTATVTVHFATIGADLDTLTPWVAVFQSAQVLPGAIGFGALGVAIVRTRAASRAAGVLLIVAGVVFLAPQYPPASVLATLGLIWVARSIRV